MPRPIGCRRGTGRLPHTKVGASAICDQALLCLGHPSMISSSSRNHLRRCGIVCKWPACHCHRRKSAATHPASGSGAGPLHRCQLEPVAIPARLVFRWRIEATFQQAREHLQRRDPTSVWTVDAAHISHQSAPTALRSFRVPSRLPRLGHSPRTFQGVWMVPMKYTAASVTGGSATATSPERRSLSKSVMTRPCHWTRDQVQWCLQRGGDGLYFGVVMQDFRAHLTPPARLLVTAERQ